MEKVELHVARLVNMSFSPSAAKNALAETGLLEFDAALQWLLDRTRREGGGVGGEGGANGAGEKGGEGGEEGGRVGEQAALAGFSNKKWEEAISKLVSFVMKDRAAALRRGEDGDIDSTAPGLVRGGFDKTKNHRQRTELMMKRYAASVLGPRLVLAR